ncbi:hypothetical protein [Mesorhizobium japonicum]|uniref:hypothetical protein n=1 Tax=Mesorhizobium japonicum TaxID=2066070 RepID=UPI003B5CB55C
MFELIYVHGYVEIHGDLAEPFRTLLDPELLAIATEPAGEGKTDEIARGITEPRPWHPMVGG